jgi:diguanylate cyclase (GGDEF)-like protein
VYFDGVGKRDSEHPDSRQTVVTRASSLPGVAREGPGEACLVVIYGADLGKRIPLGAEPIECGRSSQIGIPLDDDAVSRRHARFAWAGSTVVVSDLGSTNGTAVNDVNVRERTLTDGDQIKIGHTIFKFIYSGNIEASYHEEIYRLMTVDGLTQVQNKRSFETALEREVSRAHRYRRPLSLVLFDIDHFKKINDVRGHLAGDAVLRQLAALVSANVRREDIVARVGGEEFALLAPEIDLEHARTIAEKLRALLARTPLRFEEHSIPVTSSFGVATLRLSVRTPDGMVEPMSTGSELFKAADERLYMAKNAGRNRVM